MLQRVLRPSYFNVRAGANDHDDDHHHHAGANDHDDDDHHHDRAPIYLLKS